MTSHISVVLEVKGIAKSRNEQCPERWQAHACSLPALKKGKSTAVCLEACNTLITIYFFSWL